MRLFLFALSIAALGPALLNGGDRAVGHARLPTQLTATCDGADVRLDWAVADETDVDGYDIYRQTTGGAAYQLVQRLRAAGLRRYHCLDAGVRRLAGGGPLNYQLVTRRPGPDQSQIAVVLAVADTRSGVERSWSTIKEVFR